MGNYSNSLPRRNQTNWFTKYLIILTSLFFIQIWQDVAGFTVRLEDLLLLFLFAILFASAILIGKLRYNRHFLNKPLLLWVLMFFLGTVNTFLSPFDPIIKKDALVNCIRLVLAICLFFAVYNYPASAREKMKAVFYTILGVSFITTAVALLQMAHWSGWLPFSLPAVLIEFKEGANTAPGREIFALYMGNTGSHTWSGMLVVQAILVWFWSWNVRNQVVRLAGLAYFVLLVVILIRISVRNSILGLFIALTVIFIITAWHSRYAVNRVVKPLLLLGVLAAGLGLLFVVGSEYYFTLRILQALPQFQDGQIVISRASNIYGRFDYMASAFTIFKTYPIIGGGFYSYQTLSTALTGVNTVHAHNSYFQTIAELGLVGLISLTWLMVTITLFLASTGRFLKTNRHSALLWQVATTCFIFLAFTGLFSNTFWSPAYVGMGMVFLGLVAAQEKEISSL